MADGPADEPGGQCRQCQRSIKTWSTKAIKLWLTPDGAAWVCSEKCYDKFNQGEDVVAKPVKVEAQAVSLVLEQGKKLMKPAILDHMLKEHYEIVTRHIELTKELEASMAALMDMYPYAVGQEYKSTTGVRAKKVSSFKPAKEREEYRYVKIWFE